MTPRAILELCAGPGGWSEALRLLGRHGDAYGFDVDAATVATALAAGHRRVRADAYGLDPRRFADDKVEGFIDSPPCQPFAQGGLREGVADLELIVDLIRRAARGVDGRAGALFDVADPRSLLLVDPMRFVYVLRPRWVALEQVPAIRPVWEVLADEYRALGYDAWVGLVQAEQHGVPQVRTRAVLLASLDRKVGPPTPTHSRFYATDPTRLDPGVLPWVSMADALGWGMTHRPYPAIAAGTKSGGQDPAMVGGSGARAAMTREREAGRWIRNDKDRLVVRLSVDEAALIQSFRRGYPWRGSTTEQFQQIGNAVPPVMGAAALRVLLADAGEVAA